MWKPKSRAAGSTTQVESVPTKEAVAAHAFGSGKRLQIQDATQLAARREPLLPGELDAHMAAVSGVPENSPEKKLAQKGAAFSHAKGERESDNIKQPHGRGPNDADGSSERNGA